MKCVICGKEIEQSSYGNAVLCSSECFHDHYWQERVNNKESKKQVIIGGNVYQIGDEDSTSCFRGFGGSRFEIEFFDGRKVTTTNLWSNGEIPEKFKEQLPDNARWAE